MDDALFSSLKEEQLNSVLQNVVISLCVLFTNKQGNNYPNSITATAQFFFRRYKMVIQFTVQYSINDAWWKGGQLNDIIYLVLNDTSASLLGVVLRFPVPLRLCTMGLKRLSR